MAALFDNMSLSASRIRCRVLDDFATVMVHQSYQNENNNELATYTLPKFPQAQLTRISVRNELGKCILRSQDSLPERTSEPNGGKASDSFNVSVSGFQTLDVTLEYIVRLSNDAEMQWVLTLPEDIIPMKTERPQPVPDWDMPRVRNPESLYYREKTQNGVLAAAFSAVPEVKPGLRNDSSIREDDQLEVEEVDWKRDEETGPPSKLPVETKATEDQAILKPKLDILIEPYMSKGISDVEVSGKPLRKEINALAASAEVYLTGSQLNKYGPFTCIIHESVRAVKTPVLWVQTPADVREVNDMETSFCKISIDTTVFDDRQLDQAGDLEIICLVDCSDAMDGANMINIRRALKLVLNSLPSSCHFNVYAFGNKWSRLFDHLVPNTASFFREARNRLADIRASLGKSNKQLLPVVSKIIKSATLTKGKGRVIMISAATDSVSLLNSDIKETWEHMDVPLYSVLLPTDNLFSRLSNSHEIAKISHVTSACSEFVTEPDLLDQALMRQLRRCLYGGIPPLSLMGKSSNNSNIRSSLITDPGNPESLFGVVNGTFEIDDLSLCAGTCAVPMELRTIRPAAGDRLLQLATENCNNSEPKSSTLTLETPQGGFSELLPRYSSKMVSPEVSSFCNSNKNKWQRPWQMALDGDCKEDNEDQKVDADLQSDESSEDEGSDISLSEDDEDDSRWERSLPNRRPIVWTESFDLISQRLTQAIEHDGHVSWKIVSSMVQMPKRPFKWASHDMWATVLTMTYLRLQDRTDDPCWDMYLDKAWKWLCETCENEEYRQRLFQRAIGFLSKSDI